MCKFFKYLYFRIYMWNLRKWGKIDAPEYNAMFGVAMLILINILSIPLVIEVISGYRFFSFPELNTAILIIILLIYLSLHYFIWIYDKRFEKIIKEFQTEKIPQQKKGTFLLWFYVVLTFVVFFGSWMIILIKNSGKV